MAMHRRNMAEILPIRRKTLSNQSIMAMHVRTILESIKSVMNDDDEVKENMCPVNIFTFFNETNKRFIICCLLQRIHYQSTWLSTYPTLRRLIKTIFVFVSKQNT